jgi:hypothetical protein
MSDSFGATDLDADMPGLGPQTGNVRGPPQGLPSQLQALVQHFSQQSQGKPNPQFLPPPPGQGGQPQKPRLGSTDPPDPSAQAYAPIPANAPRPPPSFTPFIKSMPRDHSQWGQDEAFPRLPQSFELPGMYQNLGSFFGQNGSFRTAPLGAGTAAYAAAYQEAFQKGQQEKMKMAKEQLALHRYQLEDQTDAEISGYRDIYNEYAEMAGRDPTKMATQTVGGVSMHDAVWRKAVELGDKPIIAMLEDGASAEKVMRFQQDREARLQDLKKANAKSAQEDAAAELYGLKPSQQQQEQTSPWETMRSGGALAPAAPGAAPPARTPAEPDARAKGVGDPLEPDKAAEKDADDIDDPVAKQRHDAAVEVFKGFEPKDIPAQWLPYAGVEARNLEDKVGNIVNLAKQGKIKPEDVIPEIRKQVSGKVADDAQSILDYKMPGVGGGGQGGGQGGKEQNYKTLLGNVATVVKPTTDKSPGWNAANYQAQERFRTDVNTQTVILRSNSLAADGGAVLADLKELERKGVPSDGINLSGILNYAARDPTYAKLAGDWKAYNDAFNTVVTGGRHVQSGASSQESVAPVSYASPAAFRAAIKGHMNDALGYLDGEHKRWESIGGTETNMPSYNPATEKQLRDMKDMDYLTGTMPGQTYTNHKGVTKTWVGGNLNPYDPANWK